MSPEEPNWWKPLRRAAEAHGLSLTEAVTLITVYHDEDCARLQGVGMCDCEPDLQLASRSLEGGG